MIQFPKHDCSLSLTHNQHKDYYMTVIEAIRDQDHGYRIGNWVSDEQQQKAIDTNDYWTLQWYPKTPNTFHIVSAADLDVLLAHVMKEEPFHAPK